MMRVILRRLAPALFGVAVAWSGAAQAQFQLLAPNTPDWGTAYRLNTATGEVVACWYESGGDVGTTYCSTPGPGATAQGNGKYQLVASSLTTEQGIYRIELTTGAVSICYVREATAVKAAWETVCALQE